MSSDLESAATATGSVLDRLRAAPLTTARLSLRPPSSDDVTDAYVDALQDPEVVGMTEARHVRWDRPRVVEFLDATQVEGRSLLLGVFLREGGDYIGNIRLFNIHPIHQRGELSLMIFDKRQWGRGYATEALEAVTRLAFDSLGLRRVHADYYAPNVGSARAFAKAGFRVEGVYRGHFVKDGAAVDSVRVAKLAVDDPAPPLGQPSAMIPSNGPWITEHEVALVTEAAREGWYGGMTRYLDAFEARFREYTGMRHCLATSSCTGAIHLAMLGLQIGRGDEVIVPDITWVASAAPVCYVGAKPVLVDIDARTWCLDPAAVERAITRRTKAIVAVGLLGNLPDIDALRRLARRRGIAIIEDAAESIGGRYPDGRKAGTAGDLGVFSFNGTKLLVTGEGGMLATDDDRVYRRCKSLAHHGLFWRGATSRLYWSYLLGYKYKMTNVQAALGIGQLSRIDELVAKRRQIFAWYQARLGDLDGVRLNDPGPGIFSTYWIVTAIVDRRYGLRKEAVCEQLVARKIAGRPFFYPISAMPPFRAFRPGAARANPVAYRLAPYGVCLPSAFSVTEAQVDEVCAALRAILRERPKKRR